MLSSFFNFFKGGSHSRGSCHFLAMVKKTCQMWKFVCPLHRQHTCSKPVLLRSCDDYEYGLKAVANHLAYSPHHGGGAGKRGLTWEKAQELADEYQYDTWEAEYEEQPREQRADSKNQPPPKKTKASGSQQVVQQPAQQSWQPHQTVQGAQLVSMAAANTSVSMFMPHLPSDENQVHFRRSELKSLHDSLVRASQAARAAENVAQQGVAAFGAEANHLEHLSMEFAQHINASGASSSSSDSGGKKSITGKKR